MINRTIDGVYTVVMDEETGGEGAAGGGSLIADAGTEDSGTEGGSPPENTGEGTIAAPAGDQDGKPAAAADGDTDGEGNQEGAPETYEDFTIPEGVVATDEAMEKFTAFAKESNFNQADAQKALDYYTAEVKQLFAEQEQAWNDVRKGWVESAKTDQEYGGQNFKENMKHVAKAMDAFGSPELKEALNQSGIGDNPAMIRFFYRVGKLAGEGDFLTGKGDTSGEKNVENILYPTMN